MLITKDRIYIAIIIVLGIFMAFMEGCHRRSEDEHIKEIAEYKTAATKYTDKYGNDIYSNDALKLATQTQIKALMAANNDTMKAWLDRFKKIQAGVVIKEITTIREVAMPFETKIPCDFKPFQVKKLDKNFSIYSTISNSGLNIDSMFIPNKATIVMGEKKTGFLGMRKEFTVEVKNSNTLMTVSDISGFSYKPEKKWYERTWVHMLAGAGIGIVANSAINNYVIKK